MIKFFRAKTKLTPLSLFPKEKTIHNSFRFLEKKLYRFSYNFFYIVLAKKHIVFAPKVSFVSSHFTIDYAVLFEIDRKVLSKINEN